MKIGSLFSGIGGLELGLEAADLGQTIWQVEIDPAARQVLAHHWPEADRSVIDVTKIDETNRLARVDLICGGFPCQNLSSAGKGEGLAGSRSGLWFEMLRVVKELQPQWVVIENVASGAKRWVDHVRSDLGLAGYETLPVPISAALIGAPHRRERIFIIGCLVNSNHPRLDAISMCTSNNRLGTSLGTDTHRSNCPPAGHFMGSQSIPNANSQSLGLEQQRGSSRQPHELRNQGATELGKLGAHQWPPGPNDREGWQRWLAEGGLTPTCFVSNKQKTKQTEQLNPWFVEALMGFQRGWVMGPLFSADDGLQWLPNGTLDFASKTSPLSRQTWENSLSLLGNAVVPQCAEVVGHMIRELLGRSR